MINREKEEHLIERWADNRLEQKQNTGIVGSKWHAKMSRNVSVSLVSAVYKTSLFVEHNFFPNFENGIFKKKVDLRCPVIHENILKTNYN